MLFDLILAFIIHGKNIKNSYKKNKFKITAPTWNDDFEFPDGSDSVLDIQEDFKYIFKNMEKITIKIILQ